MAFEFICLREEDGTWERFLIDWKSQCADLDEDFSIYENEPVGVVHDLVAGEVRNDAAAYALHDGTRFCAMCQVNCTPLPGYIGNVLRVRMLYLSPYFDFGDFGLEDYSKIIIRIFSEIIKLSDTRMESKHIKFHLRSPADRQFFASFGNVLDTQRVFGSVSTRGSWLYITKN